MSTDLGGRIDLLGLAEHHRAYFVLDAADVVAFNKDQRLVIIGQCITPGSRQTASFLRTKGIRITCVEFTLFQTDEHSRLLSFDTVIGEESDKPVRVTSRSQPKTTEEAFLAALDENGRAVFSRILEWAKRKPVHLKWTSTGVSLNANINGINVGFLWLNPPCSPLKQSARAVLRNATSMGNTKVPEEVIKTLWKQAEKTGLFT